MHHFRRALAGIYFVLSECYAHPQPPRNNEHDAEEADAASKKLAHERTPEQQALFEMRHWLNPVAYIFEPLSNSMFNKLETKGVY